MSMTAREASALLFAAEEIDEAIAYNEETVFENAKINADTGKSFPSNRKGKMACLYFPTTGNCYTSASNYFVGNAPEGVGA